MLRRCAFLALILSAAALPGRADERVLQFLEDRHTHALLHQVGPVAEGEPRALGRADCTDVRALSRGQRNLARQLGRIFELSGVHIDLIASGRWCSALHTAQLLQLRPVTEEPALDLLGEAPEAQVDAILDLIDGQRPSETALLVTHGRNIEALTGRRARPGEIIVFRLRPRAEIEVRGSFAPKLAPPRAPGARQFETRTSSTG